MESSDGSHSAMLRVFVGLDISTESESRDRIRACMYFYIDNLLIILLLFGIYCKSH